VTEPAARQRPHDDPRERDIVPPVPVDPATARSAVVLSGGGAGGAFEIGVLKALYEGAPPLGGRPLRADVFTGTSVGSYNAAFLAQYDQPATAAIQDLERVWRERIAGTLRGCGNGIFRLRLNPFRYLDPGCWRNPLAMLGQTAGDLAFASAYGLAYGQQFFTSTDTLEERALEAVNLGAAVSREPLESLLRDTLDLERLRRSPNELAVAVSDWQNAKPIVLQKSDIVDRYGTDAILASTAIPGVFAPVCLDGVTCVDGGLVMNTPFKPAVQAGARVLHVVYTDPYVADIPLAPLPNSAATLSRIYAVLVATQFNGDFRHAAIINEEIAEVAAGAGELAAEADELPAVRVHRAIGADRVVGRVLAAGDHRYRPLEIHRYRPTAMGISSVDFLDFSLRVVDRLIDSGYEQTIRHDCEEAECVIPGMSMTARRGVAPGARPRPGERR
jgi:NTE family protein